MKNKTLTLILSIFLSITFVSTAIIPAQAFAATSSKKTTTATKKATTKKKTKKKIVKKKSVDLNPPLITLATAPHSPKPAAKTKKRTHKKIITKKKK